MGLIKAYPDIRKIWPGFIFALFVVCYITTAIAPPFQAPDEFDHVKRAYMWGNGQLVLHSADGGPSGGEVDNGLIAYMDYFRPLTGNPDTKLNLGEEVESANVQWSGVHSTQAPTGTAYYFPVLYTPQAVGLFAGKILHLSVGRSYGLARFLSLISCMGLLFFACMMYPPPPMLLALLALPMNLFLMSMPALDGMATATATVAFASFMRVTNQRAGTPHWVLNTLTLSIALVTSCRANTLPFLSLLFMAWWFVRDSRRLWAAILVSAFTLIWTLYTVKSTVPPAGPRHIDYAARLIYYVFHPLKFLEILYSTLSNRPLVSFYAISFLGKLGWLDAQFNEKLYFLMEVILGIVFIFSFSPRAFARQFLGSFSMVACAFLTLFLTFFALLIQWTIAGSDVIQGVQGRYFLIPAIALAYSACGNYQFPNNIRRQIAVLFAVTMLFLSSYEMTRLLIDRYYVSSIVTSQTISSASQASKPSSSTDVAVTRPMSPSLPLTLEHAIPVSLDRSQVVNASPLTSIDIMFGTYQRVNVGIAELHLLTASGKKISIPFHLETLVDNKYRSFHLDGEPYISGQIVSKGGSGISIWNVRTDGNATEACTVTNTQDGKSLATPGCPRP